MSYKFSLPVAEKKFIEDGTLCGKRPLLAVVDTLTGALFGVTRDQKQAVTLLASLLIGRTLMSPKDMPDGRGDALRSDIATAISLTVIEERNGTDLNGYFEIKPLTNGENHIFLKRPTSSDPNIHVIFANKREASPTGKPEDLERVPDTPFYFTILAGEDSTKKPNVEEMTDYSFGAVAAFEGFANALRDRGEGSTKAVANDANMLVASVLITGEVNSQADFTGFTGVEIIKNGFKAQEALSSKFAEKHTL